MKKKALIIGCLLGVISPITISYKTTKSHGSPKVLNDKTTTISYPKEDQDCIAWRFYLTTTLYRMVKYGTIYYKNKEKRDDPNYYGQYVWRLSETNVEEILPAKTAKNIIDTIIKKEGGSCSRKLLYETPCIMHSHRGTIHSLGLTGKLDFKYFSHTIGVPVDDDHLNQLNDFLKHHISLSPDTTASYYGFYCQADLCPHEKRYEAGNSFGFCMIKKHKKYLKTDDLFDFDYFNIYKMHHQLKEDKESLRSFIQRSNEIAAEARAKKESQDHETP